MFHREFRHYFAQGIFFFWQWTNMEQTSNNILVWNKLNPIFKRCLYLKLCVCEITMYVLREVLWRRERFFAFCSCRISGAMIILVVKSVYLKLSLIIVDLSPFSVPQNEKMTCIRWWHINGFFCGGCRGYSNLSGSWIEDDSDLWLSSVTTCSTYNHSRGGGSTTVTSSLLNSLW